MGSPANILCTRPVFLGSIPCIVQPWITNTIESYHTMIRMTMHFVRSVLWFDRFPVCCYNFNYIRQPRSFIQYTCLLWKTALLANFFFYFLLNPFYNTIKLHKTTKVIQYTLCLLLKTTLLAYIFVCFCLYFLLNILQYNKIT